MFKSVSGFIKIQRSASFCLEIGVSHRVTCFRGKFAAHGASCRFTMDSLTDGDDETSHGTS